MCHSGIDSNIDAYHLTDDVTNWDQWVEKRVEECCKQKGYILLLCGENLWKLLLQSADNDRIKMEGAFIGRLSLLGLIGDKEKNARFLPILIDHENTDLIPLELRARSYYTIKSAAIIKGSEDRNSMERVLKSEENQSFYNLVTKIAGQNINDKPPVHNSK